MNSNGSGPRSRLTLMARARRHFVVIAATGAVLTGGTAGYAATTSPSAGSSTTGTDLGTSFGTTSGTGSSSGSGLSSSSGQSGHHATSNAS